MLKGELFCVSVTCFLIEYTNSWLISCHAHAERACMSAVSCLFAVVCLLYVQVLLTRCEATWGDMPVCFCQHFSVWCVTFRSSAPNRATDLLCLFLSWAQLYAFCQFFFFSFVSHVSAHACFCVFAVIYNTSLVQPVPSSCVKPVTSKSFSTF